MNNDQLLSPLRQNIRQFNRPAIEFHLARLLKKAAQPDTASRLKTEIYLEAVKAFRVLDRTAEAAQAADIAIANIPSESLEILAALQRIRALLYLDSEDYGAAQNLIDGTDGLELVLEGNRSLVTRTEADVKVETWLVSLEIALATRELGKAENYFKCAVKRLALEESTLRTKRINPLEKKSYERYFRDLQQMLDLYGLTLKLTSGGGGDSLTGLRQLYDQISVANNSTAARELPNVPLESKLKCLLGKWSDEDIAPPGLALSEARRWAGFAVPTASNGNQNDSGQAALEPIPASALTSIPSTDDQNDSGQAALEPIPNGTSIVNPSEKALDITASALERMAKVFQQVEGLLPNVRSYLANSETVDYAQRGFSGHLLDTDLYNFMHNFDNLHFTGYLRLKWDKNLYQPLVVRGDLPPIVRSGEAFIYVIEGIVTDCTFEGQTESGVFAKAQANFILIVRLCLSIGIDDVRPDMLGSAVPDPAVAERPRLLNVRVNDLLFITSDIEAALHASSNGSAAESPADGIASSVPAEFSFDLLNEEESDVRTITEPAVDNKNKIDDGSLVPDLSEPLDSSEKKPVEKNQPARKFSDLLEI